MARSVFRLTRRQALGAGGIAVAAAAGLPLVGYEVLSHLGQSQASQPGSGWPSPLGTARGRAAHLLRRAGFGYTSDQLDSAAAMTYSDLVESVVSQSPEPLPLPATATSAQVIGGWYEHMATTAAQFPERMTLFWHGLLTSDRQSAGKRPYVVIQNQTWRQAGLQDFRSLLVAATFDPLMLRYLNGAQSTAAAPNENYSRELMELFTLGAGNYTETDVREGARALSGIRVVAGRGLLVRRLHDQGTKTYLGRSGNLGPDDVIDAILAQPACAEHIAARALAEFCMPSPPQDLVQTVASQFRGSDYDIRTLMRSVFLSDAFLSPQAYRSLVRSPAQYAVAALRLVNVPRLAATAARPAALMGQDLYNPPNVGGWPLSTGWISSGAVLARLNFAARVASVPSLPDVQTAVRDQLDGVLSPATSAVIAHAASPADAWYALLGGPEFQLH
ncbi:MAG: DUF1800 domain-containing protein [Candidatus Dormibacteraeota bacterium]|nr:DUF1800 domain-containing protein [Candidatus Dormibacteraeota bacterium]